jgi:putative transposase
MSETKPRNFNTAEFNTKLGQKTPDVVYKTAMGGGAMVVDKYPRAVDGTPVPLCSTGVLSTAESVSEVPAEAERGSADHL